MKSYEMDVKRLFGKFFSSGSIILWALKMFHKNRERFDQNSRCSKYSHIKFVRLRSGREVQQFVANGLRNVW